MVNTQWPITIYRWEKGISVPSSTFWQRLSALLNYQVETFFTPDGISSEPITDLAFSLEESSHSFTSISSQGTLVPAADQARMTLHTPEESHILLEQQRLILAEQRLAFHHNYLQYVRDLVEVLLLLLDPNATQRLRMRLLEYLFCQVEQIQQETNQEFIPFSFSQIQYIFELANQEEVQATNSREEVQAVSSKEFNADDPNFKKKADSSRGRLRDERLRRGWTYKDVADQIHLPDPHTVGRWERGKSMPSPHYRRALSNLFGKHIDELGFI